MCHSERCPPSTAQLVAEPRYNNNEACTRARLYVLYIHIFLLHLYQSPNLYTYPCLFQDFTHTHTNKQNMHKLLKHGYLHVSMYLSMDDVSGSTLARSIKVYDHLWPLLTGDRLTVHTFLHMKRRLMYMYEYMYLLGECKASWGEREQTLARCSVACRRSAD